MNKTLVINLTSITQHVGVIHASGEKDDVQIMPRRRVELRVGMTVDPAWLGRNLNCVKVVKPQVISPTVVAPRRADPVYTGLTVGDLQPGADDALVVDDLEIDDPTATQIEGEGK